MLMLPNSMYIAGMRRMAMMLLIPAFRIFISAMDRARDAMIATAAVMSAFSSHRKRNIAAGGKKLSG